MRTNRGHRSAAVLVTAVVLALIGALLPSSAQAAPTTGNDVLRGVRYAAYGPSFGQVHPGSDSVPSRMYPSMVRDSLGADPALWSNETISGASTAQILARARSTWNRGDYGVVSYLGNQNDVGRHVLEATFTANVRGFIDVLRGGRSFVVVTSVMRSAGLGPPPEVGGRLEAPRVMPIWWASSPVQRARFGQSP